MSAPDRPALTGAQRRRLRGAAQRLEPVVKVGQEGLTDAVVAALDHALERHELVKVRFAAHKEEKEELAPRLADRTGSELITVVGHVAVYFRPATDPARRKGLPGS